MMDSEESTGGRGSLQHKLTEAHLIIIHIGGLVLLVFQFVTLVMREWVSLRNFHNVML
jgi:hypothetical protein